MATLVRSHDWSQTPLGAIETWSQSLRASLNILLASRCPMYLAWEENLIQFYNDAYSPFLGSTQRPAALGQRASECFSETWDSIGFIFGQAMAEGKAATLEDQRFRLDRHGSAEEGSFTFSYNPISDEEGQVSGVLVTVIETTQQERNEQRSPPQEVNAAIQRSEDKTWNILESIHEAFFALDENWQFAYVNQSAGTLLERTPDDLIGKNLWEEYPGLSGNELAQIYWSAMGDRIAASSTAFYPDHDRWYEVRTYPAPSGISVYFRNVTEQIQTEAALRQSEERYRTLFESIDEGFCVIEVLCNDQGLPVDYRVLEVNPTFEQQTGLQQAVVILECQRWTVICCCVRFAHCRGIKKFPRLR